MISSSISVGGQRIVYRGATVRFSTSFYDIDGSSVLPSSAFVNVAYIGTGHHSPLISVIIPMSPPVSGTGPWTADWDTRGVGNGPVSWSVHDGGSVIPFAVEDGLFILSANNANLETF